MVNYCAAFTCREKSSKDSNVKFHRLPEDPIIKEKWLVALRWKHFSGGKSTTICSKHFLDEDYFINPYGNKVLKREAVPTKFNFPQALLKKISNPRREIIKHPINDFIGKSKVNMNDIDPEGNHQHDIPSTSSREVYPILALNETAEETLFTENNPKKDEISYTVNISNSTVNEDSYITAPIDVHHKEIVPSINLTPKNYNAYTSNKNISKRCRTCLTRETSRTYTTVTEFCNENITIKNAIVWIMPNLQVEINENDSICNICLQILRSAVDFVVNCLKSDATLQQELENNAETEDLSKSEEKCTENDTRDENVLDNEFSTLSDYSSSKSHEECNTLTKDIEFWNRCCETYNGPKIREELIYRPLNPIYDFEIKDHEELIKIGPLRCSIPDFLNSIKQNLQENIQVLNYSGHWGIGSAKRILLLGSKFYKKCPICNTEFSSDSLLDNHFDQDHKGISKAYLIKAFQNIPSPDYLKCDICTKDFKVFPKLKDHSTVCLLLKCPYCKVLFPAFEMGSHIKEAHKEFVPLRCYKCERRFNYYRSFKEHPCPGKIFKENRKAKQMCRQQRMKPIGTKRCKVCKEVIPINEYATHINSTHLIHTCSICDRKFVTEELLANHKTIHRKELCFSCGFFIPRSNYYRHIRIFHKDDNSHSTFDCSICKKKFNSARCLKGHIRRSHSRLPVICEICGIKCQAQNLKDHQRTTHSGIKNYICQICDKQFSRKDYLAKHVVIHGVENRYGKVMKDYICQICDKQFSRQDYLAKHVVIHGLENRYSKVVKQKRKRRRYPVYLRNSNDPISCKFCLKTFKNIYNLRSHIETHIKLVRYKCKYCDMTYSNKANRTRHEKLHKDKNYKFRCNTCWKNFSNKEELDVHESSTHNKKFQCEYCQKSFSREFAFISHLVEVHYEMETIMKEKENLILETLSNCTVDNIAETVEATDNNLTVETTFD